MVGGQEDMIVDVALDMIKAREDQSQTVTDIKQQASGRRGIGNDVFLLLDPFMGVFLCVR